MSLTAVHKAFIAEYLKNGYNGTQAYLKVRPRVSYDTARATGAELLAKSSVKEIVDKHMQELSVNNIASRQFLIGEAHNTGQQALESKQYKTKLYSIDLKARLNRLYDREQPDLDGYTALLQQITINVGQPTPEKSVIDVTPEPDSQPEDAEP